jgi:DNA-binding beta-propeller fold protein YncE
VRDTAVLIATRARQTPRAAWMRELLGRGRGPSATLALLLLSLAPLPAWAGWQLERLLGSPGRALIIIDPVGGGKTIGAHWVATRQGVLSYRLSEGIVKVLGGAPDSPHPLVEPLCATGDASRVYVADGYDGRLKVFNDWAGYEYSFLPAKASPQEAPLMIKLAARGEGLLAATYDFTSHRAMVKWIGYDGRLLGTIARHPSSPGDWDWIFGLAVVGSGFYVYVYHGDGRTGQSWIERRELDGGLTGIYLLRPEGPLPPWWFACRDVAYTPGASYFLALAPGPRGEAVSLVRLSTSGAVEAERADVGTVVAEPWLRFGGLEFKVGIFGLWPQADRPGHVYLLNPDLSIADTYQQTPGPSGRYFHPCGVAALGAGQLAVADTDNYRCLLLSPGGSQLVAAPCPGRPGALVGLGDGRLVAVNLDQPQVPDYGGLLVITPSGKLATTWGPWGSGPGALAGPRDLALGPDGNLYVADTLNHRVQVFSSTGQPLRSWGGVGEPPGHQFQPHALAVAAGRVFTAEDLLVGGRIVAFDLQGKYLRDWPTAERVVDLVANDNLQVCALTETGRIVVFNEFGEVVDSVPVQSYGGAPLAQPQALALDGNHLYVADTGNSRLVELTRVTLPAEVSQFGPALLPARSGVLVTVTGQALPRDLVGWLALPSGRLMAASQWADASLVRLNFALEKVTPGAYDLYVAGTGLGQMRVGTVTVSSSLDANLVGTWQLVRSGPAGHLLPDDGKTLLTVELDGGVRWERVDGSGQERSGGAVAAQGLLTLLFTTSSPAGQTGTEAYAYTLVADELTLAGQPPATAPQLWIFRRLDTGRVLDPAVAGVWTLWQLDTGQGPQQVSWQESWEIDSTGAYVLASNTGGVWGNEIGQVEAHDGRLVRTPQNALAAPRNPPRSGTFTVSADELVATFSEPQARKEWWRRSGQAGPRPLLWTCLVLEQPLWRGRSSGGRIYLGNHGQAAAREVSVRLSAPWLGTTPVQIASLATLAPHEVTALPVQLTPPSNYTSATAYLQAQVAAEHPVAVVRRYSRRELVRAPQLDVGIRAQVLGGLVPGAQGRLRISVLSRGVPPAEVLSSSQLQERAFSVYVPEPAWVGPPAGRWDPQRRLWWASWQEVVGALRAGRADLEAPFGIAAAPGTRVSGLALLHLPPTLPEASPQDNAVAWQAEVRAGWQTVELSLQPSTRLLPGDTLQAQIVIHPPAQTTLVHRATVLEVDPWVDLTACPLASGYTLDWASRRIIYLETRTLSGGDSLELQQPLPLYPSVPLGSTLNFAATCFFDNYAPVRVGPVSVTVGGLVGDLNGDGLVNEADLAAFALGWQLARSGYYYRLFDLAPLSGSWPNPVSQPDGRVDGRDAAAMLEAVLFHRQPP